MTTRDRILDAAANIMHQRGVGHATTKEIARAAGYSEATLYKHFSDKENLIVDVLRERMPDLSDLQPTAGQNTVTDNLARMARTTIRFYQQALPLFGGLLAEHTRITAHREAMSRRGAGPGHAIARVAEYLRAEQQLGRVAADADTETVGILLDGACFHQAFLRYYADGPDGESVPEATIERIARTLDRTLRPD